MDTPFAPPSPEQRNQVVRVTSLTSRPLFLRKYKTPSNEVSRPQEASADHIYPAGSHGLSCVAQRLLNCRVGERRSRPPGARPSPCEPPTQESRFPAPKEAVLARATSFLSLFGLHCGGSCDAQGRPGRPKHTGTTSQGWFTLVKTQDYYHGTLGDLAHAFLFLVLILPNRNQSSWISHYVLRPCRGSGSLFLLNRLTAFPRSVIM